MKVLLLGAYGNTGRQVLKHMLSLSDAFITVAGPDAVRIGELVSDIPDTQKSRVAGRALDAMKTGDLKEALRDADIWINCAGLTKNYPIFVDALAETNCDNLEIGRAHV